VLRYLLRLCWLGPVLLRAPHCFLHIAVPSLPEELECQAAASVERCCCAQFRCLATPSRWGSLLQDHALTADFVAAAPGSQSLPLFAGVSPAR
jgi:hypothetical protein